MPYDPATPPPPPVACPAPVLDLVWYGSDADGKPTGPYATPEELQRAQDWLGCYGGEVEHLPQAGVYRCPDFDNEWRAWPDINSAVDYYNYLAR